MAPVQKRMTFSLSQLAGFFKSTRETVSRRLSAAGVEAAAMHRGNPRYLLRDAANAWYMPSQLDPDEMPPFARRAHYSAELLKLSLEKHRSELVNADDLEREEKRLRAVLAKNIIQLSMEFGRLECLTDAQHEYIKKYLLDLRHQIVDANAD